MIELVRGNLLEADVEALVNPVNIVGVMGKGLALAFKQVFPETFGRIKKPANLVYFRSGLSSRLRSVR